MNDRYVKEYAQVIAADNCSLSQGLFHAEYIMREYKQAILDRMEEAGILVAPDGSYRLSDIGWDDYDESIELIDCVEGFTMTQAQVDLLMNDMGFKIIFVNYKNHPDNIGKRTPAMLAMPVVSDGKKPKEVN